MTFILSISTIGAITGIYLGFQFIANGKKFSNSNYYLGIFFLLLAIRIGKLLIQELGAEVIQELYFNVMHASYLALGPIIWLYIMSYFSFPNHRKNIVHFIPALTLLLLAFQSRQILGEYIWINIYWSIQVHPLIYVLISWKFLNQRIPSMKPTINQVIWLRSVLGSVLMIAVMNALYFVFHFPFYVVTSFLLLLTTYLIVSLAFNGKLNVVIGKSDKKYKNLNVKSEEIKDLWKNARELLKNNELFLDDTLKLVHVSDQLNTPPHVLSMVINSCSGQNFTDYINSLRIERAQQKLSEERSKKILAIAMESGFSTLSAFNKAFKKTTGLKPSEYRSRAL